VPRRGAHGPGHDMRVVATAGHVDHGKSTLIEALTGTHPDRLQEEKDREMTIDLGFAWMQLPDGQEVGIVDVPGHRDFVENMLAGVSGIDAVLLVVAADEGIMPQTREHLAIIDLLGIPSGLVALTKRDLVTNEDQLRETRRHLENLLRGTVLEGSGIVEVSARDGRGLNELKSQLSVVLGSTAERQQLDRPRLPIDRVFTMSGHGTVVTGTLSDGDLKVGQHVEVLPDGIPGRIRGLQTHKRAVETAVAGSRTAVNLAGIPPEQVRRGYVVSLPGQYAATRRFDARLRMLPGAATGLAHGDEVKVFLGTAEAMARVRLLGIEDLPPGQEAWIQLEVSTPVVCVRGDRLVVRRPSPPETLGGGTVVDPHPAGRHKRFDPSILTGLSTLSSGNPQEVLIDAAVALGTAQIREIVTRSQLAPEVAENALRELLDSGRLVLLEQGEMTPTSSQLATTRANMDRLEAKLLDSLQTYHSKFPLRAGMPRQQLRGEVGLEARAFNAVVGTLESSHRVRESGAAVSMADHSVRLTESQQAAVHSLLQQFEANPYSPPTLKECKSKLGEELMAALIAERRLLAVSPEIVFQAEDYDRIVAEVRRIARERGSISIAELRDQFRTSRRYAQAILEHLDSAGVTRRAGEAHVLAD
jgi:selenocysteine-specific elongation factor